MKIFFLLTVICTGIIAFSQKNTDSDTYAAQFLMPYNDHGKWGWSDTLGNILIEPQYEYTTFFNKTKPYRASVHTKAGVNYYIFKKKSLLLPINVSVHKRLTFNDTISKKELFIVKDTLNKYGLFDESTSGYKVPLKYDTCLIKGDFNELLLFKARHKKTYDRYVVSKQKIVSTKIVRYQLFEDPNNNFKRHYVFHYKNGKTYELVKGELLPFDLPERNKNDLEVTYLDADVWGNDIRKQKRVLNEHSEDGIIFTHTYRGNKVFLKYGFKSISLVRKNGLLGLVDDNGTVLLDFKYDQIIFSYDFTRAELFRNGNIGFKIIFTHYPTIEPKYDKLVYYSSLRINKKWSFSYYKIEINGQSGFVGENGIEYFNFD